MQCSKKSESSNETLPLKIPRKKRKNLTAQKKNSKSYENEKLEGLKLE
jgi:hypothetical protein